MNLEKFCDRLFQFNLFGRVNEIERASFNLYCQHTLQRIIQPSENIIFEDEKNLLILEYNETASELLGIKTYYVNYFLV